MFRLECYQEEEYNFTCFVKLLVLPSELVDSKLFMQLVMYSLSCCIMQHIEDLTQEKFSLQRALEASRALSESLAAENSSLTDTYNQQVEF